MNRLDHLVSRYPRQFWLMFCGMFISTVGASMIWPFLMMIFFLHKATRRIAVDLLLNLLPL